MKIICKILIIAAALFMSLTAAGLLGAKMAADKASSLPISAIDPAGIADGSYTGSYTITPVSVQVTVTVQDRRIADIRIDHHANGLGTPAENITDTIIASQSLEVDAVSGATVSSICIKKAVENALTGGKSDE